VNPTQFGPGEDYERYPRDEEGDLAALREAGVDVAFLPDAGHMYPAGFATSVRVGAGITERLCGAFRPGHFEGVTTVVAKLMSIVQPTRAYFGEKDYQQALVIRRMAADLNLPVDVVTLPTIREQDGLAVSSRNRHLGPEERRAAAGIYRALSQGAEMLREEVAPLEVAARMRRALEAEALISEVEYAGVYDPETLEDLESFGGRALLAAAVKMSRTRLIDNVLVR
jgi:pantoate--beta-alanine ligase